MPKIIAGIAVMPKVKNVRIASTSDVIASPLVLASGLRATVERLVKTQLHERHNWTSSGFSVPHFGQYICIFLSQNFDVTIEIYVAYFTHSVLRST